MVAVVVVGVKGVGSQLSYECDTIKRVCVRVRKTEKPSLGRYSSAFQRT